MPAMLLQLLIPVLSGLVTEGVKRVFGRVPKKYLPITATIAGVACQAVTDQLGYTDGGLALGAVSGLAATGIHQTVTQVTKKK